MQNARTSFALPKETHEEIEECAALLNGKAPDVFLALEPFIAQIAPASLLNVWRERRSYVLSPVTLRLLNMHSTRRADGDSRDSVVMAAVPLLLANLRAAHEERCRRNREAESAILSALHAVQSLLGERDILRVSLEAFASENI